LKMLGSLEKVSEVSQKKKKKKFSFRLVN